MCGDALAAQVALNQAYTKEHAISPPLAFNSHSVKGGRLGVFAPPHLANAHGREVLADGVLRLDRSWRTACFA